MSFWSPDPSQMAHNLSNQQFQAYRSQIHPNVTNNIVANSMAAVNNTIAQNRVKLAPPPPGSVVAPTSNKISVVQKTFQQMHSKANCVNLDSVIVTEQKLEPAETKKECDIKCNVNHPIVSMAAMNCKKACLKQDN